MPSGTFTTTVQSVALKSAIGQGWFSQTAGPTFSQADADLINRVNLGLGTLDYWNIFPVIFPATQDAGSSEITFNINTGAIVLAGDISGSFNINALPAGFNVLTARFKFHTSNSSVGGGTTIIRSGISIGAASPDVGTDWDIALDVSAGFLALFLDTYGFQTVQPTGGSSGANWNGNRQIGAGNTMLSGTWDLSGFQFTYTLDPPSGSDVNANNPGTDDGDIITITSDPGDPDALLLNELTLSVACGTVQIITQEANILQFRIPASCGVTGGSTVLTATGNGTQFSGSVPLGILIVLATNGSGIYVLDPTITHDVIYSSLRDGSTRNVKIPNPFFKTGFIRG